MRQIDIVTQDKLDQRLGTIPNQLVSIVLDSSDDTKNLYLNAGFSTISYQGKNYTPGATVLGVSEIQNDLEAKTNEITLNLSGIPNTAIAALNTMGTPAIGGIVTIYQCFIDEETGAPTSIYQTFKGVINSHAVLENNDGRDGTVTIAINIKNILNTILDTTSGRFTSNESLQQNNNGDKSYEFVASLVNWNPQFGREN